MDREDRQCEDEDSDLLNDPDFKAYLKAFYIVQVFKTYREDMDMWRQYKAGIPPFLRS